MRVTDVTADGCAGGLVCSLQESRSSRASASVQALAGIDVGVVGPLAVGSTLRLIVPLRGPEDADVRLIVAARLGFG